MRNFAQKRNSAGSCLALQLPPKSFKKKHTMVTEKDQLTKLVIYCSFFNKKVQKTTRVMRMMQALYQLTMHWGTQSCMIARDESESALHSHSLVLLHENWKNLENNIQYVLHLKSLGTTTSMTILNVMCTYYTPPGGSMREQSLTHVKYYNIFAIRESGFNLPTPILVHLRGFFFPPFPS